MSHLIRYRLPLAIALLLTAAALLGVLQAAGYRQGLSQEHAYLAREVQEGLSALQRDLLTADHIAGTSPAHTLRDVADYLSARREAFAPVLWLGRVSADTARPAVLLDSAALHGYDPRRDVGTVSALAAAAQRGLAAAIPTGHHSRATLALAIASAETDGSVLVALIDVDALLDDSLQAHVRQEVPTDLRLNWQGQPVGRWPHDSAATTAPTPATAVVVGLGPEEFTVVFSAPGWQPWFNAVLPLPLTMLAAAALALAVAARPAPRPAGRGLAALPPPVLPSPSVPASPTSTPPTASALQRDRLWHLGELAASLAHDLGQPLNVIRLNAEAVADSLANDRLDQAKLRRALDTMVDQTVRVRTMVDGVIAASRRPAEAAEPLDPRETMRQVLAEQLPLCKRLGAHLQWHADPVVPMVAGHAPRLAAALRHLLVNAVEAIATRQVDGGGGTVWVECRRAGDGVDLVVADDGPGFPPPVLAALGDPTAPPMKRGKGCGLGLAIVSGVVAEMGGTLSVADTRPGARVSVHLPAVRRAVILADDDPAATASLAEVLDIRGWQVRVAHGGNQAWALFHQAAADAVVTDLHMADGDGWQLIERLRGLAPDLPIVAVTAASDDEARRAVGAGATLVVRKPVSAREIASELEEMLSAGW